jgi:tryptophanyl-tRNA synthetase
VQADGPAASNYLGAIRNYVASPGDECIYCIVGAATTIEDCLTMRQNTYEMALDWLAAGIRGGDHHVNRRECPRSRSCTLLSMVTPWGS